MAAGHQFSQVTGVTRGGEADRGPSVAKLTAAVAPSSFFSACAGQDAQVILLIESPPPAVPPSAWFLAR